MAIPSNRYKLYKSIMGIATPYAWFSPEAYYVHLTGGEVDTWNDVTFTKTLTDQSVAGNRPPWDGSDPRSPFLNFDGSRVLYGLSGLLAGQGGCTVILVGQLVTPAGTAVICGYETSVNDRFEVYVIGANTTLHVFLQSSGGAFTDWGMSGNADTSVVDVFAFRGKFADTTTAVKPVRTNGTDEAGSYGATGAASSTFATHSFSLGAFIGNAASLPSKMKVRDLLICPYMDNTTADLVQQCLKALRGTP